MIPINKPWLGEEEKQEILKVFDENALTSAAREGGKRVRDFESLMKNFLSVKHVIAVNSGTAALHAALLAAGIKMGDEVLLPSFTFVATANAIAATGAKPVFVDINKDDYTIDSSDLEAKITSRTKAVIPVHLYGHSCRMDEIREMADRHSLQIIEDACQSLGSTYKNKQTGTFGIMGCFSLYASKVLTAGEGGAVATDSDEMADLLKMIRNHGMVEGYDTRILGLNLRLPELSAAIAKIQMKKLPKMLDIRKTNANHLTSVLKGVEDKIKLPRESDNTKFNWYLYTVAFNANIREKIKHEMIQKGIGATVYYDPPVHKTPYYSMEKSMALPSTEWASEHVLSLPVHPLVSQPDIEQIGVEIKKSLKEL